VATEALQQLGENPHPISEQNFFDLFVTKSAFDQFSGEISGVRMVDEIGNEVGPGELRLQFLLRRLGPLTIDEFKEIETNPDAINSNQTGHMLDMVNIAIKRGLLLTRTDEDGIDSNDAAPFPNHPDLFVANIALDVVIPARIGMRHDERFGRVRENIVEACRINVG
jgi:hypothetical protein